MLKKLFKSLTTLTLLAGCYFGYVHGFAIVVEQLRAIKRTDNLAFPHSRLEIAAGLDPLRHGSMRARSLGR